MDLDARLEAVVANYTRRFKDRLARKGNQTIAEFMLEELKARIRELDPDLDPESPDFRTAVILMAAATIVGPRVDLLVQFTGYSMIVVAGIASRMRASGLWTAEKVCTEEWFDSDGFTGVFWADCLVADGMVDGNFNEAGEFQYSMRSESESKKLN